MATIPPAKEDRMSLNPEKELARRLKLIQGWQTQQARIDRQQKCASKLLERQIEKWDQLFAGKLEGWPESSARRLIDGLQIWSVLNQGYVRRFVSPKHYHFLGFDRSPDSCRHWGDYEDIARDMETVADYWQKWVTLTASPCEPGTRGYRLGGARVTITLIGFTPSSCDLSWYDCVYPAGGRVRLL